MCVESVASFDELIPDGVYERSPRGVMAEEDIAR